MNLHYQWIIPNKKQIPLSLKKYSKTHNIPLYIIKLMYRRGLTTPSSVDKFLHPHLSDLGDPFTMHDMAKGIKRMKKAIANHEKITIYGDYDTDGITSTSIMYMLLKHFHANVHYFIPNRFRDGYGPNLKEYKRIIANGTKLLITVDNGISGYREIAYARKHGMDVIITDHHDFPKNLPPANAIIMAQFPGHKYNHGKEDYCGAGIAFKIAQAWLGRVPADFLDIATLGTIADSVSLTSEDRIIVANGVKRIRHDHRPGIVMLAKMAHIHLDKLTSTGLSFSLIPRLNALGRMGDANIGVKLLTTSNWGVASIIARKTEIRNKKRQNIMRKQAKEALQQAKKPQNLRKCTLVLANKRWFPGIVGIVASRVLETYYKPTIVIGHLKSDDQLGIDRGSGRSIPEFNLFEAMDPLRETMTSFGGHPMACGLSIKPKQIKNLSDGLEKAGIKQGLDHVQPKIKLDLSLAPQQISFQTIKQLKIMEPFGVDNQQPMIDLRISELSSLGTMGKDSNHLWMEFSNGNINVKAVFFGEGKLFNILQRNPDHIEIAGNLNINHFRGHNYLQIIVHHIRHYRTVVPGKQIFAKVYKYLRRYSKPIPCQSASQLNKFVARRTNVPEAKIELILTVFDELGLSLVYKGKFLMNQHPQWCRLSDSKTYQEYAQK